MEFESEDPFYEEYNRNFRLALVSRRIEALNAFRDGLYALDDVSLVSSIPELSDVAMEFLDSEFTETFCFCVHTRVDEISKILRGLDSRALESVIHSLGLLAHRLAQSAGVGDLAYFLKSAVRNLRRGLNDRL